MALKIADRDEHRVYRQLRTLETNIDRCQIDISLRLWRFDISVSVAALVMASSILAS